MRDFVLDIKALTRRFGGFTAPTIETRIVSPYDVTVR